jgi:hypothetical protein
VLAKTELPKAQEIFQNVKPQYLSLDKLFIRLELAAHEKPQLRPFKNLAFAFQKLTEAVGF